MGVKVANNATSTLAANITAAATSIGIVAGEAAKFPVLAAGDWFPMTIVDAAGNMEIVKVTARNSGTLTVVRAQEGTIARAFAAGSRCDVRLTTAALLAFISDFAATLGAVASDNVVPVVRGGLGTTTIAAARTALALAAIALSGSASDLSTGTLAAARLSGNYSFSALDLTNRLLISGSAPYISLIDTTSGQLSGRLRIDANNLYFDSSADDTTFAEVFRFELDTKIGYVNGSPILTAGTHSHLAIGATAATARTAIGINSALIGSLTAGLAVGAQGTYALMWNTASTETKPGSTRAGSGLRFANANGVNSGDTASGTWMCMGYGEGGSYAPRVSVWLRIL